MMIILCGYMGSGKSLIGKLLARQTGFDFVDLDQEIARDQAMTIPQIFQQKGEIAFRKIEMDVLARCLKTAKNTVLALGGGTPCYGKNLQRIKETEKAGLVYLNRNRDELTQRLFKEREQRPLLQMIQNKPELDDYVRKHLFERQFYYLQADVNLKCTGKSPEEIIDQITQHFSLNN